MEIPRVGEPGPRAAGIVAAADEIERTRRIPEALLERLHASRLFRMLLPRAAGGDETDPALYVAAIEVADRARVRLACTNAIQAAAEVADFAYKGAGVDAIFPGRSCSASRPRSFFERAVINDPGNRVPGLAA